MERKLARLSLYGGYRALEHKYDIQWDGQLCRPWAGRDAFDSAKKPQAPTPQAPKRNRQMLGGPGGIR